MKKVIQNGDTATGHRDILGNAITGTITCSAKMKLLGTDAGRNGDIVNFPSHPHALDGHGNPTNYRSHAVAVIGTAKLQVSGQHCAVDGDRVPVADEAGPDANMIATQTVLQSN